MNHPILVAALAEDRRRQCPYGAVTRQPYGLCRECQAVSVWRFETARTRRRAAPTWTRAGTVKARLLARAAAELIACGGVVASTAGGVKKEKYPAKCATRYPLTAVPMPAATISTNFPVNRRR